LKKKEMITGGGCKHRKYCVEPKTKGTGRSKKNLSKKKRKKVFETKRRE